MLNKHPGVFWIYFPQKLHNVIDQNADFFSGKLNSLKAKSYNFHYKKIIETMYDKFWKKMKKISDSKKV